MSKPSKAQIARQEAINLASLDPSFIEAIQPFLKRFGIPLGALTPEDIVGIVAPLCCDLDPADRERYLQVLLQPDLPVLPTYADYPQMKSNIDSATQYFMGGRSE